MSISKKKFKSNNVTMDDVIKILHDTHEDKPKVSFPFDGFLDESLDTEVVILTKILYINYRDSTQIKNKDIEKLRDHIKLVLSDENLALLRDGEINDQYIRIVNRIAIGHGITGVSTTENNLTSFASKFCGSHNQKAPFWDNQVSDLLMYLGFKHEWRNYHAYVEIFRAIQKEYNLEDYSLREIELAMWQLTDIIRRK